MPESFNCKQGTILSCVECGQDFVYTIHQQDLFASKGWLAPKRCPLCRKWKRFANQNKVNGNGSDGADSSAEAEAGDGGLPGGPGHA